MKKKLAAVVGVILLAGIYYYVALPAVNVHSVDVWYFVLFVVAAVGVAYALRKGIRGRDVQAIRESKVLRLIIGLFVVLVAVYLIGSLLSSPIVNAKKYQKLLTVEEGEFASDIEELSFDQIPLLDRESAQILGNRKMGSMVDMVSQFEVDELYSQINYKDRPVRVSPLRYASLIKWFTNRKDGIPAYIRIDMANQNTELVKLSEGMKYSTSEHFGRNIYRYLRFAHPTYIYNELSFEIDDDGVPYWIAPVKKYNIGLFGGETVGRVVLCNAITGELQDYPVDEVPEWIDRAYSADLLVQLYDYYGTLQHGFLNSVLSQKDCLNTTNGYNYLAIDDDVWVYTGVTSVNSDQSNVGFVLMNQRTMETRYYKVEGAIEDSAMASAEGQVQNLAYHAAFPLLLNISGEPTYFLALKDDAGLVKKYAMLNVQRYQTVAIGDTVAQCESQYQQLLLTNGLVEEETVEETVRTLQGTIVQITPVVIDGNSHDFLILAESDAIFDVTVADQVEVIRCHEGDTVSVEYVEGTKTNRVTKLEIKK